MAVPFARRISHRLTKSGPAKSALNGLRHRGISSADVFVASFPKSGNTWLKFMMAHLLTGAPVDFNSVERVVPDIGGQRSAPRLLPDGGRLLKTHEPRRPPWGRLYRKAIYIVRDGRDVAVSYYFSMLRTGLFEGSFEDFVSGFLRGEVGGFGSWHEHVRSWSGPPSAPLLLRYEDLLADTRVGLEKAVAFIGIDFPAARLDEIVEANRADAMRSKESGSRIERERVREDISFVRKAASGEWREHFDDRLNERFLEVAGSALASAGYV